jgi:Protein of unknown function (DUF3891)
MLLRKHSEGVIAISQPAHAWVSGQIARHWGKEPFISPSEEVCLAAEQHDIGFLDWERSPDLDPATGFPYSFMDLPQKTHLDIWRKGIQQMLRFGRYPALLVSMHFSSLCRQKGFSQGGGHSLVDQYLEEQEVLQTSLKTSLSNDYYYAPLAEDEALVQQQKFVSLCDWLSLLILLRFDGTKTLPDVATRQGAQTLCLKSLNSEGTTVAVHPWPFRAERLRLVCEGRHLLKPSATQEELHESFRHSAPVTVLTELQRGE